MTIGPRPFAAFRIAFGIYLVVHFAALLPYGAELFSRDGLLPDPRLNPTHGLFPNVLDWIASRDDVSLFLIALVGLAALFALGIARRACAIALWYGWACLFNRNNLIANPSIPYVGLLLLATCTVPRGEGLSWRRARSDPAWRFPRGTWWTVWLLPMAGYTFSGFTKLASPSWVDGSALRHVLENPLARPGLPRDLFLALPTTLTSVATWSVLAVELTALPLALWRRTRFLAWTLTGGMHLVVLLFVSFADLSLGMLMVHAFTFDPAWLISTRVNRRDGLVSRSPTPQPEPIDADAVNAR